jgi:hypothetical protein
MKIDISKEQTIFFDIDIEGKKDGDISVRLLLSDSLTLCFDGTLSGKKCTFVIPNLNNVIKSDKIQATIELIHNNQIYTPWKSVIDVEQPMKIKITPLNEEKKVIEEQIIRISEPKVKNFTLSNLIKEELK